MQKKTNKPTLGMKCKNSVTPISNINHEQSTEIKLKRKWEKKKDVNIVYAHLWRCHGYSTIVTVNIKWM